jgi:ParB/RepB/Spo0J family partition protein
MKTKELEVSKIKEYPKNPRINQPAVAAVKASLERYGYTKPIVVDKKNMIVMGHTRYKAIKELGWDKIAVIVSELSDAKNDQLRIIDNKTSEFAQWDMTKLLSELNEMSDRAALAIYFSGQNLENLLNGSSPVVIPDTTAEDITAANNRLAERVQGWNDGNKGNLIEISCSYCGEMFLLDKEEIKRRTEHT